jgi:hypothetical protein
LDLSSLIQTEPHALAPYQPRARYLLLDERSYRDSEISQQRNLVAAVFRLENSRTHADLDAVLGPLMEWLSSAEELQDIRAEIAERYRVWGEQIKREGAAQGEAHLLLRQLRRRFGELPEAVTARVKSAPVDQVESWAEELLDAASLDALFREAL